MGSGGFCGAAGSQGCSACRDARPQQRFLQRRCAEDPEHVVMAAARAFVGPGRVEKGTLVFGEHKRLRGQLFWGNRRESGREVPQRACGVL